jgi:UrcA family protein
VNIRYALLLAGAWAVGTGHTFAASVVTASTKKTLVVRYDGSRLAEPQQAKRLYTRLRNAAHQVCDSGSQYQYMTPDYKNCIRDALTRAVAEVDHVAVTAIHDARNRNDKFKDEQGYRAWLVSPTPCAACG